MTTLQNFPEDLIILILLALPVKILMRFRCVCKSWYDLIRSPKFIEMHLLYTQHKKNERILIHRISTRSETVLSFLSYDSLNVISPNLEIPQLNFDSNDRRFDDSNPCNGLLLLVSYDTSTLILCNPATKEFKLLPPHPFPSPDRVVYKFGLGFDSNKNEYKAFIQLYDDNDYSYISLVYNVSTNLWRQIDPPKTDDIYTTSAAKGILYNGALNWAVGGHDIGYYIIIYLDMSTEVFQEIKLPQIIPQSCEVIEKILTILNDCLALFTISISSHDLESKYVDIWVMKEYGDEGSWIKQFSVTGIQKTYIYWHPCLMGKNKALLLETKTMEEKRKLVSCDRVTHNMIDTRLMNDYELLGVMVYKESLVSV